jgi:hypothetical protein
LVSRIDGRALQSLNINSGFLDETRRWWQVCRPDQSLVPDVELEVKIGKPLTTEDRIVTS